MFSNLQQEFTSDIALPVAQRAATTNGGPIDCEPAVAGTDQARLEKKYRFVFVTAVVGTITDGTHEVTVEASSAPAGPFTQVATTGPLTANSAKTIAVRRAKAVGSAHKFIRLVHKVTGAATGGVVGGVIQRPKALTAATDLDLEQVMRQCMYAVGTGAQMPIHAGALERICLHVREGFTEGLTKGGNPAKAWKEVKHFLLACCEEIGRKAAEDAHARSMIAIPFRVDDALSNIIGGLAKAYDDVRANNDTAGGAGEYCPTNAGD